MPGIRKATLAGNILRKIALQEIWTKKQSHLPQFSLVAVRELGKTQAFEDGLTNISFCKQATLAARLAMSNVDLKITHFLFKVRHRPQRWLIFQGDGMVNVFF